MYNVWKNALAEIEQKISAANFSTWFSETSLVSAEGGKVVIGVKNSFYVKQLKAKFLDVIKVALESNGIEATEIDFTVLSDTKPKIKPREVTGGEDLVRQRVKEIKTEQKKSNFAQYENGLNEKYTLDSFVVGSNNDLAVGAAKSIIDAPGTRYNPFFLYGGPGLGKTHLVQAIGNELLKRNPKLKILYTPINHFYSDFVNCMVLLKNTS